MKIVGYSNRFSVRPGQTICFMVSSEEPTYRAEVVRLRHTDENPRGPGWKSETLRTSVSGEYRGRKQDIHVGSHAVVPHHPSMSCPDGFTLQAWIYPTTPHKGVQGLMTKFSERDRSGYGLYIDEDGSPALWIGNGDQLEKVRTGVPLQAAQWVFVTATYDAAIDEVRLYQKQQTNWPPVNVEATVRQTVGTRALGTNQADFLMAAGRNCTAGGASVCDHFNGKIDNPRLFGRALDPHRAAYSDEALIANWDFSQDIAADRISDIGTGGLHGRAVNLPTRAVTGHNWNGDEAHFTADPSQYGAIHFHDDDLEDAQWEVGFEWTVPDGWPSGVYAARLQATDAEDYLPFFVVPAAARARIAFLAPTLTYLVYANQRFEDSIRASLNRPASDEITAEDQYMKDQRLLSCYDLHNDGTGVCYSSRLRPILNFRPGYRMPSRSLSAFWPRHLNGDMHLLDWLDSKGFDYDVVTDDELHHEGVELLARYPVVLTGTHPEYWTAQMLKGMEAYQADGGRLMYLGGNGFYWITSFDPQRPHIVEVRRWRGTRAWEAAPGECYHSTTGEMGRLWRFRNRAPQKMVGVGFTSQGGGRNRPYKRQPGSFDPRAAFIFDGIGNNELIGNFPALLLEHGAGGFEIDRADYALETPEHAMLLATADGFTDLYQVAIEDQLVCNPNTGGSQNPMVRSDMIYLQGPKGGATFSVGSISWCSCLSYNGGENNVSRITENVLRRFVAAG